MRKVPNLFLSSERSRSVPFDLFVEYIENSYSFLVQFSCIQPMLIKLHINFQLHLFNLDENRILHA